MPQFKIIQVQGISIYYERPKDAAKLRRALKFLAEVSSEGLNAVRTIFKIAVLPGHNGYNELFVVEGMWLAEQSCLDCSYQYLASILVHESEHIRQHRRHRPYRGARAEKEAYSVQRCFLKRIHYASAVKWLDEQYTTEWWTAMDMDDSTIRRFKVVALKLQSAPLHPA
jgi:hypothetical protein